MVSYDQQLFINLKSHKNSIRANSDHALHFPIMLCMVISEHKKQSGTFKSSIYYSSNNLLSFKNQLGLAINTNNYEVLSHITLSFMYSTVYYNPIGKASKITFTPEVTSKFSEICNSFIGESWDDVVDPFVDALYELITAGYLTDAN